MIGQPAAPADLTGFADLAHTLQVPDIPANDEELSRARIPKPSFYLLRPDGHVGLAGTRLDAAALGRYVREHLGLRTPGTH